MEGVNHSATEQSFCVVYQKMSSEVVLLQFGDFLIIKRIRETKIKHYKSTLCCSCSVNNVSCS